MSAGSILERHYSIAEISEILNLSKDAARTLFEREDGVFLLGDTTTTRRKRRYTTLRIPESVFERVCRRCLISKQR